VSYQPERKRFGAKASAVRAYRAAQREEKKLQITAPIVRESNRWSTRRTEHPTRPMGEWEFEFELGRPYRRR
jgi:hypothetical protein